jgi:hypothetical protein
VIAAAGMWQRTVEQVHREAGRFLHHFGVKKTFCLLFNCCQSIMALFLVGA